MKYIMRKLNSIWETPKFETKVVEAESIMKAEADNRGWVVYEVLPFIRVKKGNTVQLKGK